jgi:hypothetical protein
MPEDDSVQPVNPIPPMNKNPNPNNPSRWSKPKSQANPETPTPSPTPGSSLSGSPPPGSGETLDYKAMVSGTVDFIASPQGEAAIGVVMLGLVLLAAVASAPATVPALGIMAGIGLLGAGLALGNGAFQGASAQQIQGDPLLLDLNGDGVKTTDFSYGVFFDHDNNGFAKWSTWVDDNDGILAVDLNNNGTSDDGTEIFGNNTVLPNGSLASDGYAALRAYDSNSDGVVNNLDQNFSQLKLLKGDRTLLSLERKS